MKGRRLFRRLFRKGRMTKEIELSMMSVLTRGLFTLSSWAQDLLSGMDARGLIGSVEQKRRGRVIRLMDGMDG